MNKTIGNSHKTTLSNTKETGAYRGENMTSRGENSPVPVKMKKFTAKGKNSNPAPSPNDILAAPKMKK